MKAARAGGAGAGFAVVADEVRKLAVRSAEAAQNTSKLIEGTVKKTKEGGELVQSTNQAFTKVAVRSQKATELMGEIASSSQEQAQRIDQVNKALAEMDKSTSEKVAQAEKLTTIMSAFKTDYTEAEQEFKQSNRPHTLVNSQKRLKTAG